MKTLICITLGFCLNLSLFAQDQVSKKLLAKTDQWSITEFRYAAEHSVQENIVQKIEMRAIRVVSFSSPRDRTLTVIETKVATQKHVAGAVGNTHWEIQSTFCLSYGLVGKMMV